MIQKLLATEFGIPVSTIGGVHTKFKDLGMTKEDMVKIGNKIEDIYEIELPTWHLFLDEDTCGIKDLLKYLNEQLGPEFPHLGYLELTDVQFDERYKPELTEEGTLYRQREWTDPEEIAEIRKAIGENRCWTAVEGDDGQFVIVWGNRTVNRLYNIITKYPIENESWTVEAIDPDEEVEDDGY